MAKMKTMDFNTRYHLIGRIWIIFGICLFFSVPITMCLYYQTEPNWAVFADAGIITLLIVNLGSCLGEPILYAPMLGTNSEYLAFITGNLSNLKIPCVVRAHEVYEADRNSEEYEIISTISVATSTLITIVIIAVFVLVLALANGAIDAIRANEWITPAFSCVVYALFGSLGGKYVVKNPKLAIPPLIIIVVLSIVLGFLHVSPGSVYLVIGIVLCLVTAIIQVVREKKKQAIKKEEERLAVIANGNPEIETAPAEDAAAPSEETEEEVPEEETEKEEISEETPKKNKTC